MASDKASVEISAKTVEEAIEEGLAELGLTRDQAEIDVVKPGRSGVLGFGAEEARVRITRRSSQQESVSVVDTPAPEEPRAVPVVEEKAVADLAISILQGLLDRMSVRAQVTARVGDDLVEEGEDHPLVLDITGDDLGILIGRRGETLRALQYMTRLMLSRHLERWEPVVIDVESYRVRRRHSLRQLAIRMAERVAISRQRVVLEAMPAHERRIVHIALRDHVDVATRSIGDGEHRKVTIIPR